MVKVSDMVRAGETGFWVEVTSDQRWEFRKE